MHRRDFLSSLAALSLIDALPQVHAFDAAFQIGIADFVLHGQMKPQAARIVVQAMADLFAVPGKPKPDFQFGGATALANQLRMKKIHLVIMTGIEFAWTGPTYPELKPLVTAFTSDIRLKACVLAPIESNTKRITDLKGQVIVLPRRLQHYPLLYLQQEIEEQKGNPKSFFSQVVVSNDTDEGIEDVIDKKASAILVDAESWRVFLERKPGRAKKLKVVDESEPFPTTAVLYHPDTWSAEDLKVLKNVLCTAHERPFTRQILNFWRISKFVPYTAEYQQVVNSILSEIPRPMELVPFQEDR